VEEVHTPSSTRATSLTNMADIQAYDAMSKDEQKAYDKRERQREEEEQAGMSPNFKSPLI
jgi:hypothetical protein